MRLPQEPTLRWLSIHLKYQPWKLVLVRAYTEIGASASRRDSVAASSGSGDGVAASRSSRARAIALLRVLKLVCASRSGQVDDAPWAETVGRNVSHVSGPITICIKLGVIRKTPHGTLRLGAMQGRYEPVTFSRSGSAIARLQTWVRAADAVGSQLVAPRTCRQWIDATAALHSILHRSGPMHIKPRSKRWLYH